MRLFLLLASLLAPLSGCYNPDILNGGYACDPMDDPPCPGGFDCVNFKCVSKSGDGGGAASSIIPKTGAPYAGTRLDPMLNDATMCPDAKLEPNDNTSSPIVLMAPADSPSSRVTNMAICPKGENPGTGSHDIDYFKIDTSGAPQATLTMMAEVFYDITYGDLDVGIFDSTGRLLSADGSSVTNACTVATVGQDVHYVVIGGANSVDSNRYEVRIRTFTASKPCPTGADM